MEIRIIDANYNRLIEGIRVIEDITRFAYNDQQLTEKIKSYRHQIAGRVEKRIGVTKLITGRDVKNDYGKETFLKSEKNRTGIQDILRRNFRRVEESLRVLEEISKIDFHVLSRLFKKYRFIFYAVEKELILKRSINYKMGFIAERGEYSVSKILNIIETALKAGITFLQYKDTLSKYNDFCNMGVKVMRLAKKYSVPLIIYNRVTESVRINPDGIHLEKNDCDIDTARSILGLKIIGKSVNSIKESKLAQVKGIDFIQISSDIIEKKGIQIEKMRNVIKIPIIALCSDISRTEQYIENGWNNIALSYTQGQGQGAGSLLFTFLAKSKK